jgi:tRNA A-37 threonylcarbamoyl transferase component Bud32
MLKTVEKYEVVDEIGHGGMATVYRARDTRLNRLVALKVMHPHLQGALEARQRFAREAVTVARLHHPSILEIYDYSGESSEVSFIATELLTGPTLKRFADDHPEIPPEIAACMTLQVARALGAAHAEGVIHRDVKPENVLFHENRCLKLTDFGIAQLVDVQSMTTTGQVLGSPGHMAPEQIEGRECDARTDLFSLGTVLYLLATGKLPFTGTNPHQVLKRIMEGLHVDPQQVRPVIGGKLARIIRRLLEVEPDKRYANAVELEHELLAFIADVGIDSPDQALADYLKDPEGYSAALRDRTIEKLTALGEAAQRRGDRPTAMDHWNRVLALDENNARVMAQVQQLGRRSALRRNGLRAAGALVVIGLAFGAYTLVRARNQEAQLAAAATAKTAPAATERREPRVTDKTAPKTSVPPTTPVATKPNVPRERDRDRNRPPKLPKPAPIDPTLPRRIVFDPFPANMSIGINGADPRPFGPSFRDTELVPGTHRFKFVGAHDCCIDEEISLLVEPSVDPFTIVKRLKFRPAGLYVVTETPANVIVDEGRIAGRTNGIIEVGDMDNLTESHRIKVSAEGHNEHTQVVRLRAGQVVEVPVQLTKAPQGT